MSNAGIVVIVLLVAAVFFLIVQVGPAYLDKWELQDWMKVMLLDDYRRIHREFPYDDRTISGEGEYQFMLELKEWCAKQGIPLDPTEDDPSPCTLRAELWNSGRIECHYSTELNFIFIKRPITMTAVAEVKKVPGY